jgi:4-oxalocrotonate tautomerase
MRGSDGRPGTTRDKRTPNREKTMPIIRVELLEGRSIEQKRDFVRVVTREAASILKCSADAVDIVFVEVARQDWATGGMIHADKS